MNPIKNSVFTIDGGSPGIKFALHEIDESMMQLFYGERGSIKTKNRKLPFVSPFLQK